MRRFALVGAVVALAACKHKDAAPAEAPHPSPPQAQSRVDTGLLGELSREAAQRPKTAPTSDDVLLAFEKAGVTMGRKQQVLATPVDARYCVAAASKAGLNLSLCEYATSEEAKAGREKSLQVFKALKGRTLLVQNGTLLTLMPATAPAITTERDLAEKAFRALISK